MFFYIKQQIILPFTLL